MKKTIIILVITIAIVAAGAVGLLMWQKPANQLHPTLPGKIIPNSTLNGNLYSDV